MRKIWIFFVLLLLPLATFAWVEFFALLPNPFGPDELWEYIEIRNTGCVSIDIWWYHLYDAANKTYIIPAGTNIWSHTNITFPYRETKISLNNSTNESITLTNPTGMVIDTESYSGTQRDNIVIYLTTTDDGCMVISPIKNNTGTTNSGTSSTGETNTGSIDSWITSTGTISTWATTEQDPTKPIYQGGTGATDSGSTNTSETNSGSVVSDSGSTSTGIGNKIPNSPSFSGVIDTTSSGMTNTGTADTGTWSSEASEPIQSGAWEWQSINISNTGAINTGILIEPNPPSPLSQGRTGATSTGTTDTGTIQNTNTGILFPDIFPTRQEPTNAIFSWGTWDCGTHQPCRINVTFDPIFTGGLLAKNYICEVITATGTLVTCNPNTLYFSADSSFSLRLTSKSTPSQSRTVSWGVSFTIVQHKSSTGGNIGTSSTWFTSTGTTKSGSWASEISEPVQSGAWEWQGTGVTQDSNTPTLQDFSTWVTFPEIILTFQNYTNMTHSGDILTCVTSPCRVNFTLDPIFTGSFVYKNYTCEIHYGTGVYNSCNPPQLYPIGTDSIEIILTHRASWQKETKTLEIVQAIPIPVIANDRVVSIPGVPDTNPPIAILEFDGKIQSYYEQIDTYEFNCYTLTCSINLTADRSYDSEWWAVRFLWYYGPNDIKITRDPGGRKYGLGDHEIWLRVMDIAGNMSEIRYRIHVLGPKDKEEQVKTKKIKDPSLTKTKNERSWAAKISGWQKKKKKKKPKKMDFFDPPTITLQKSKFTKTNAGYLCRTKTKTCSLNLTLSGAEKWILYTWTYDDGEVISSKNPRSKKLSLGSHEITVAASYSGSTDILWTQTISARVDKISKPKKAKKIKAKKPPKTERLKKPVQSLILPPASEQPPIENDIPYTTMALISGIIPVALLRRFLINKI